MREPWANAPRVAVWVGCSHEASRARGHGGRKEGTVAMAIEGSRVLKLGHDLTTLGC